MSDRPDNRQELRRSEPRRSSRRIPNANKSASDQEALQSTYIHGEEHDEADARTLQTKNQHPGPRQARGGKKGKIQKPQANHPSKTKPTLSGGEGHNRQPAPSRTASNPAPQFGSTPKAKLATPMKATATTPRPYAGPGFHNSPDPSTLRLPKAFSKSVPNVNKTTSFSSMMENRFKVSPPEKEDANSNLAFTGDQNRPPREESPLDMLFRADRAAKAKLSQSSSELKIDDTLESSGSNAPHTSKLPLPAANTRHHTRHHTDGNAGAVFRMEMEDGPDGQCDQATINKQMEDDTKTSTEDPLLAKTRALKQLLNFPGSRPHPDPPNAFELPSATSFTPSPTPKNRSSSRLSRKPPVFPKGMDGSTPDERQQALLALAEKQIASYNMNGNQRPPSSGLSKEFKSPASPVGDRHSQPPSTPTPSNRKEKHRPATRRHPASAHPISAAPPTISAGNTRQSSTIKNYEYSTKDIEDDLRRILKLDVLPSESVPRV